MYDKKKIMKIKCLCDHPDIEYKPHWLRKGNEVSVFPLHDDNGIYVCEEIISNSIPQTVTKKCNCTIM